MKCQKSKMYKNQGFFVSQRDTKNTKYFFVSLKPLGFQMKSQASLENIILIGFVFLLISTIFYITFNLYINQITSKKSEIVINTIAKEIDTLWIQPSGSNKVVQVDAPIAMTLNGTNNLLNIYIDDNKMDTYVRANISGQAELHKGINVVTLTKENGIVKIRG